MERITLTNIAVYAYHGCLEEEGMIGSDYRVDVSLKTDLRRAVLSDALQDTVDYGEVARLVKEEMAIRSKLLEHVAGRLLGRIFADFPSVKKAIVTVSKINPPVEGSVQRVSVIMCRKRKKDERIGFSKIN